MFTRKFTDVMIDHDSSVSRCEVTHERVHSVVSLVRESRGQFYLSTRPAKNMRVAIPDQLDSVVRCSAMFQEQPNVQEHGKDSNQAPNQPSVSPANICSRPDPKRKEKGYDTDAYRQHAIKEFLSVPKDSGGFVVVRSSFVVSDLASGSGPFGQTRQTAVFRGGGLVMAFCGLVFAAACYLLAFGGLIFC